MKKIKYSFKSKRPHLVLAYFLFALGIAYVCFISSNLFNIMDIIAFLPFLARILIVATFLISLWLSPAFLTYWVCYIISAYLPPSKPEDFDDSDFFEYLLSNYKLVSPDVYVKKGYTYDTLDSSLLFTLENYATETVARLYITPEKRYFICFCNYTYLSFNYRYSILDESEAKNWLTKHGATKEVLEIFKGKKRLGLPVLDSSIMSHPI